MNPRMIEDMGNSMGEVYEAVTNQILINLAKHFQYIKDGTEPAGAWQYQVKKLAEMGQVTKETEQIILSMLGEADEALQGVLEAAIRDGLKDVEPALKQAAERGLLGVQGPVAELAPNQMQAFQAFYRQSADKLNLVNTTMLRSTQQAYQSTVADIANRLSETQKILNVATGEVVTGVTAYNTAVRGAVKKMVDNGLTGFVDKSGRHWSPEAYVSMDVRTTAAQTSRRAVYDRMADYASDLYQVSYHDGARPLCYPWQGKVISRDEWSRDVTDGDGNTVHVYAQSETSYGEPAGLFGINCGHYPIPFIPGFSSIRPPKQDAEENAKEYAESQKQRELERKLRNEKRDLAVLKAQGADQAEIDAQKAKVNQARDNLDDFCTETGRARRKSREYVPIKPEWPDTGNVASQATPEQKKVVDFTPAKTLKEAQEYAESKGLATSVTYNGSLTVDAANAINKEMLELRANYPTEPLREIAQNARTRDAVARSCGGTLEVNGKLFNSITQTTEEFHKEPLAVLNSWKKNYPDGIPPYLQGTVARIEERLKYKRWSVSRTYGSTAATIPHEYAHIMSDQYFGMINKGKFCSNWNSPEATERRRLVNETFSKAKQSGDIYGISEYANANAHEFLAESFAAQWMGEKLPKYISDMLGVVFSGKV